MNRHRELAQMMRTAGGGVEPPGGPWVNYWRMIDCDGSVAPDSQGNADLTVTGSVTVGPDGVRLNNANSSLSAVLSQLAIPIKDGTQTGDYSILICLTMDSQGLNNNQWARIICSADSDSGRAMDQYIASATTITYRMSNNVTNNETEFFSFNPGDLVELSLSFLRSTSIGAVRMWVNGVFQNEKGSASDPDVATAHPTATVLNFMNKMDNSQGWDGECKWAGISDQYGDKDTIRALFDLGRQ